MGYAASQSVGGRWWGRATSLCHRGATLLPALTTFMVMLECPHAVYPEQIFACVSQLGGTVGDIESMPFIEAFRQFQFKVKRENFCNIHVSLVPQVGDNPSTSHIKCEPAHLAAFTLSVFFSLLFKWNRWAFIEIIITITIIVSVLSLVLQESRRLNRHKTACESSVVWACHLIWSGRFPLFICFKQIQNLHMGYSMKTAVKLLHEWEIPEKRNFEEQA